MAYGSDEAVEEDMSMWMIACVTLSAGGAAPAVILGVRGAAIERLVGLQQLARLSRFPLNFGGGWRDR